MSMLTTTRRIPDGTDVTWTLRSGRGLLTYSGKVLTIIPENHDLRYLLESKRRQLGHLKWASEPSRTARVDRYIIETATGCRTVVTGILEKCCRVITPAA